MGWEMTGLVGAQAVVIGSGIAGLFAARVLADHVGEVVLMDRDDIASTPNVRDGVPQGKHFHGLLAGGLKIAGELFPKFTDDLDRAGAIAADIGQDLAVYQPQGKSYAIDSYKPEPEPLGTMYVQSRALLEHCIRQRVEAVANVTVRYGTRVDELMVATRDVVGVVTSGGERLEADLVVDATGRNSHTARWLEQLGYAKPRESVVNCDFAYSSAFLRPRDPEAVSEVVTLILPSPLGDHSSRLGALVRLEDDVWLAGLAGRYGDFPPADWEGFRSFGKTLPYSIWDELVETADPIAPPAPFRFPRSVRRHYEQLDEFPSGLLPIGDAICHYNPFYGQGMSAAAGQAAALGGLLAQRAQSGAGVDNLAMEFFPHAYEWTRAPWAFAAAADFADPRCTGDFPTEEVASLELLQFITSQAPTDPAAAALAHDVASLSRPLEALHQPPWPQRLAAARSERS